MSNYVIINTLTLLPVSVIISLATAYLLTAWNFTTLPILVSKLFKFLFLKTEAKEALKNIHTRTDWEIWSTIYMPGWLASLVNCPVCQTPYATAVVTLGAAYVSEKFGLSNAVWLGVWAACLFPSLKLAAYKNKETIGATVNTNTLPSTELKISETVFNKKSVKPVEKVKEEITNTEIKKSESINENTIDSVLSKSVQGPIAQKKPLELFGETNPEVAYNDWTKEMGIQMKKGENGENIVTGFNPIMLETFKFFEDTVPCFFDGCEELKAQYNAEIEAKGANCPACQKSEVRRKYMILVKNKLEAAKKIIEV